MSFTSAALIVGLLILIVWPVYHVALAGYAAVAARRITRRDNGVARHPPGAPATFWIVIPCLNEELVVARTVRAALAQHVPGAQTRVMVIDDGSDDNTPRELAGIHDDRLYVLRRELPEARRGKGEALNAAYRLIRGWISAAGEDPDRHVLGIIDGDGRGSPSMLAEIATLLHDPTVGAVQCRVRIHNRNRLWGMAQDLEFGMVADAHQIMRDTVGSVSLGGNGQFVRLSALTRLGESPWSDCLVEDLELGLRLHLARVRIRYAHRASVHQQGVVNVRRLLRQRTRWAQGNLQCIRYLAQLFRARRIRNHTFVEMSYYLLAPWLNAVGALLVAGLWAFTAVQLADAYSWLVAGVTIAAIVGAWVALMLVPGLLWAGLHWWRLRAEPWWRCLGGGLMYPFLLLLSLVSTWRAVGRHLTGRRGWAKTERLVEAASEAHDHPHPVSPSEVAL